MFENNFITQHGERVYIPATVSGATTVIYTVPANYVLYLTNFLISITTTVKAVGDLYIRDDSPTTRFYLAKINLNADTTYQDFHNIIPPYFMPEGWTITVNSSNANLTFFARLLGYKFKEMTDF